jgi:hypothetical protein
MSHSALAQPLWSSLLRLSINARRGMSSQEVAAGCDRAPRLNVRRSGAGLIETVVDFRMVLFQAERGRPCAATGFRTRPVCAISETRVL